MKHDYIALGLKCGLEIHQQLSTEKLFCNCDSILRNDFSYQTAVRHLRAVAGEHDIIDATALHEQQRKLNFVYEFGPSQCLVELDEEPPHTPNKDALTAALQTAMILNASVFPFTQIMRKIVIDGSNTAGFQRTCLLASSGSITTSEGNVGIATLCLEEDSARLIAHEKDTTTYRLDRLGIPLIEIATAPDIKTPGQCKEVAKALGMTLRSTGKAKRGIGTIRQDVNVSILGGARIEIKGVQDLHSLPEIIDTEITRQLGLLELAEIFKKRKPELTKKVVDLSLLLQETSSKIITDAFGRKELILGMRLDHCGGIFGFTKGKRFGSELADHARVNAGVKGIFHSDELPGYGIELSTVKEIQKKLGCKEKDGFIIVAAPSEKAERALDAIFQRLLQVPRGVTSEVRKANQDGSTSYLRPMPGAARMYPETDIQPILLSTKNIKIPQSLAEKKKKYSALGLGNDLAEAIVSSEEVHIFEQFTGSYSLKPSFIAEMLIALPRELYREHGIEEIGEKHFVQLFDLLEQKKITKDACLDTLKRIVEGTYREQKLLSEQEIAVVIAKIKKENPGAPFAALMGHAMKYFRGKVDGARVAELLKK